MKKGFWDWFEEVSPDVLCLQETKAQPGNLNDDILKPKGYHAVWNSAERKGYSGVVTFSKEEPKSVALGLGVEKFDMEGRVIRTEHQGSIF